MKKIIAVFIALACVLAVPACSKNEEEVTGGLLSSTMQITEFTGTVSQDTKYGSAIINVTPDDFEAAGFTLGDSCTIEFGNGYAITDVPYFNGYYVKNGEPVIVAYPGFNDVRITYNNEGIWETAALTDGTSVTITLENEGEYSTIQEVLGQVYSFDRSAYDSDTEFCNFRALAGGDMKENFIYRGASPVDNSRGRASYTDELLRENNIQFVIDLADSEDDMKGYIAAEDFASPYTESLYENGRVVLLDMSSSYGSDAYRQKVAQGLEKLIEFVKSGADGNIYIHCMEGKDRTGFVCFLLEALAGASYEDMRADYMITYRNYYGFTEDDIEKYDAISELYFDAFVEFLTGTDDRDEFEKADYPAYAANYLISGGMTEDEAVTLTMIITGK